MIEKLVPIFVEEWVKYNPNGAQLLKKPIEKAQWDDEEIGYKINEIIQILNDRFYEGD
jgi:hypothetical protein